MNKSSNDEDKRSASQKLVDAFFEENLDVALKEFSDFLLTDFTRVMEKFQEFAKERQKSDFKMLNRLGMLDPDAIDKTAKEFSYDLQEVINRFILDLRDARLDLIDMSAKTALVCFKGVSNE